MIVFSELTEKNLFLYAAKHYKNPKFSDIDDFYEDTDNDDWSDADDDDNSDEIELVDDDEDTYNEL